MNLVKSKRLAGFISAVLLISSISYSQTKFNMDFMKGGVADGGKIIGGFVSPWMNAFGAGLNGGWYNTAKPHKLGGFDVTASVNFSLIPTSAKSFDLNTLGLKDTKFSELSASTVAPTIAGAKNQGPGLYVESLVNGTNVKVAEYNTPAGTGINYMFTPIAQVGVGLPFGTELKFRYLPRIPINKYGNISLWGIGVLHSVMQYIPGHALTPFDVSVFGGYTKLVANVPISMQPSDYSDYSVLYSSFSFANQKLSTSVKSFNASIIGSVKLLIFTVYGSLGYVRTNTTVEFRGVYPFPGLNSVTGEVEYVDANVKRIDPIEIKGFSGMKSTIGLKVKLSVIAFNVDYSRAQYNIISTGLGITFR
jgi:hypothetical protein